MACNNRRNGSAGERDKREEERGRTKRLKKEIGQNGWAKFLL